VSAAVTFSVIAATVAVATAPGPAAVAVSAVRTSTDPVAAFYRPPDPLAAGPPGSIIRSEPMPSVAGLPQGTTTDRILYHSRTIDGSDVAVSGMIVIPKAPPPRGGYPIVSWAHATTGLASSCAPSNGGDDPIPYLARLVAAGYVVAATDYQGLGTGGLNPYLVGQSAGQSVLDAARAARSLLGARASNEVLVFGHSQGGQAALFAGQIAASYAPELFVAGVVAVAPASDIAAFAPAAVGRSTDPLAVFAVSSLVAWSQTYPDLRLATVLTPRALAMARSIDDQCISPLATKFARLGTDQLFRPGWAATASVRLHESQNDPGGAPIDAPVLVVQGRDDTLITPATTTALVDQRLCGSANDSVTYDLLDHAGHTNVLTVAQPSIVRWIEGRLSGKPRPPNTCATATPGYRRGVADPDTGRRPGNRPSGQTSRNRRTAKAEPSTPTTMPTSPTKMQVLATCHPPIDISAIRLC
jgi:pimeloyl-ACP methyl ester carboxylesterase